MKLTWGFVLDNRIFVLGVHFVGFHKTPGGFIPAGSQISLQVSFILGRFCKSPMGLTVLGVYETPGRFCFWKFHATPWVFCLGLFTNPRGFIWGVVNLKLPQGPRYSLPF